jgi:membrane protein DedA with SNARE-associated domain
VWCFVLAGVGWALGSSWESFHEGFRFADYAIAAAVVFAIGFLVLKVVRRRRGMSKAAQGYTGPSE